MKKIRIGFTDFWGDFDHEDNFIVNCLRKKYVCELSDDPDYLFYSLFGNEHLHKDGIKIMFVGENIVPDFNVCDYALGFDWLEFGDRYMRLPLYLIRPNFGLLSRPKNIDAEAALNRKFCSIVVSNAKISSPERERFFRLLSEYKRVDSGGRLWNNVGGPVADKLAFVGSYKFNIAFENSSVCGYTTEKIMDPMTVGSIPVYWGNPLIGREFNTASFVNVHDFGSMEAAVERIVELDNDDDSYLRMLGEPWVADKSMFGWEDKLAAFMGNIVDKPLDKAGYTVRYGMQKLHRQDLLIADFFGNRMRLNKMIAAYKHLAAKFGSKK